MAPTNKKYEQAPLLGVLKLPVKELFGAHPSVILNGNSVITNVKDWTVSSQDLTEHRLQTKKLVGEHYLQGIDRTRQVGTFIRRHELLVAPHHLNGSGAIDIMAGFHIISPPPTRS